MKVAVTTLVFCVTSLLALGLVMLYSASMMMVDKHTHSEIGAHMLVMQLVWCALGLIACVVVAAMDYQHLKPLALPCFVVALVLATLVFVPHIGVGKLNGAHRWIGKFGVTCQPSEIVKIALILMLARYIDFSQRKMNTFQHGVVIPGAIIGVALALIFIEPDRGTTILLAAVSGTMLYLGGAKFLHLLPAGALGALALWHSLKHDTMRSGRINAWLHPEAHAAGVALQGEQAKIAIGSGGFTGLGLGDGLQKHGFLPEIQSDFIFANIGEELGLVATGLVLVAFLLIALCGLLIAYRARDQFGCLLALGVTSLISFQAIINIGVVTSVFPNKGLALPFISAGGSSLVAMLLGVGMLLSVARQATQPQISASDFVAHDEPNPFAAKAA